MMFTGLPLGGLHEELGLAVLEGADDVLESSDAVEELLAEGHEVIHVDRLGGKVVGLLRDLLASSVGSSSLLLQLEEQLVVLLVKVCVLHGAFALLEGVGRVGAGCVRHDRAGHRRSETSRTKHSDKKREESPC